VEDLVTMLTCKSLVRVGHSGERPIEQSSSWLLLKFPPGKQILILYVVLFGKANEYEAWRYLLFSLYYQTLNVQTFYIINFIYYFTIQRFSGSCYGKQNRQCGINR